MGFVNVHMLRNTRKHKTWDESPWWYDIATDDPIHNVEEVS